ncbi:MAG: hypothetical protein ACFFF4_03865 [Candidatus Thorarchaeota archaeon]
MSTHRMLSPQKRLISLAVLVILSLFLPVGIRYANYPSPSGEQEFWLQIESILPFLIELYQGDWTITWFVSTIGILIPIFLTIHLLLVYQVLRISRGQKELSSVIYYLAAVVLISLVGYFPTFQVNGGNIPLPLMFPIGLVFAKYLAAPPIDGAFDEKTDL